MVEAVLGFALYSLGEACLIALLRLKSLFFSLNMNDVE